MSEFQNEREEQMNYPKKGTMENKDNDRNSVVNISNGHDSYVENHLTDYRNIKRTSCEKKNSDVFFRTNSTESVSRTVNNSNYNNNDNKNLIDKYYEGNVFFSSETNKKGVLFNNAIRNLEKNENTVYANELADTSTHVKKPRRCLNTNTDVNDDYTLNENGIHITGIEKKEKNEIKSKAKEACKDDKDEKFLFNTTYSYLKNVVKSRVKNEQNNISNQNLENVKSITVGNWNFSTEIEKKKKNRKHSDETDKKETEIEETENKKKEKYDEQEDGDNEREETINKKKEIESIESIESMENKENIKNKENKEVEKKEEMRNYKIPFYSWIYTNRLEKNVLNNIYEMLDNKIVKSEEQDKEINEIKNDIINMYKRNLNKPLTLEYCVENIKGNKKIVEILFYVLQNSNVINIMHDPKYNELKMSDQLNIEKIHNFYNKENSGKHYVNVNDDNKKTDNFSERCTAECTEKIVKTDLSKVHNKFSEMCLTNNIEDNFNRKNDNYYVNAEKLENSRSEMDINSRSVSKDISKKRKEEISNDVENSQGISPLIKKKKLQDNEKEIKEDDQKDEMDKFSQRKEKDEGREIKEKKMKEKQQEKENKEGNRGEEDEEEREEGEEDQEKENSYSIYACVSCGAKCQYLYYILKPNKIKNVSFGILDKCVWCSECYHSSKYPNVLSSSNFVKVIKPNKSNFFKWTVEEVEKLIEGIQKYKNQWNKISEHVKTKTAHECIFKFLTMPLSVPYFNVDKLIAPQKNVTPLSESNNSLLSLLTCICSYVSPYIGAYAAKKIVDTILEKQKRCIVEMEQKMKEKQEETSSSKNNEVRTDPNASVDIQSDNNVQTCGNNVDTAVEEQSISTYILSEQEMKEIHNIVIDASKERAKELADLEKNNLKNLLQQLVILNTKKMNLKLKQYEYIQKYLKSQNQQMAKLKKEL